MRHSVEMHRAGFVEADRDAPVPRLRVDVGVWPGDLLFDALQSDDRRRLPVAFHVRSGIGLSGWRPTAAANDPLTLPCRSVGRSQASHAILVMSPATM